MTRTECVTLDLADPLARLRDQYNLDRADAAGLIYLDGNSLGVLPRATPSRVQQVVEEEWGVGLIRSWNSAGWIDLSARIGDKIARLIGAAPGEVAVGDSTSVNLYKILSAAVAIAQRDAPGRRYLVSERTNFPSDLYIADTLAKSRGLELVLVDDPDFLHAQGQDRGTAPADHEIAIVMLTHVNYRTGRMHRMVDVNRAVHDAGAIMVWDLAHSAGAVPVDLHGSGVEHDAADFAVGCGYKYLNGGPGAPAFAWAHPRHTGRMDREGWRQPLAGWLGHAAPFEFTPDYRPARGMARFISGTPPLLSLAALECGVDTVLAAEAHGGVSAIRDKSIALTDLFIDLVRSRLSVHAISVVTPPGADDRGSQVALTHATGAFEMVQALIARGVIGDFRAPDILRFGFTPLYTRFSDAWDAVDRFEQMLVNQEWQHPRFSVRGAVT